MGEARGDHALAWPSGLHVEEMAANAIFDLQEPEVRIEARLARHALLNLERRNLCQERGEKPPSPALVEERLRSRTVEVGRAVEAIDFDEDGAGLRRSATAQNGRDAQGGATPEMGGNPEI